jgi:uncharacterized membrane protein
VVTAPAQLLLFLSSFAPLFGVFALLDSFGRGWPSILCLALSIAGVVILPIVLPIVARRVKDIPLHVDTVQVRDGDALAYIATYLVPFAAFALSTTRERVALLIFFVMIALIYIRSALFYVNPLLALAGYRLYQISSPKGASVVLITPRRFIGSATDVPARRLSDYVWWEARSHE